MRARRANSAAIRGLAIGPLQRSRARESAEGLPKTTTSAHSPMLQRSRARESAEGKESVIKALARAAWLQRSRARESAEGG